MARGLVVAIRVGAEVRVQVQPSMYAIRKNQYSCHFFRRVFFTVASANLLVATGTLQSAQIHDKKDYQ
ncbi:hypothetical protein U9M48_026594, partial [Paspalum notatum var. saurae]